MHSIRTALFCAVANFRKWYRNPTIIALMLLWFVFNLHNNWGMTVFCMENGYRVTPWLLPFYIGEPYVNFTLIMALIILFSQAPFNDSSAPFILVRTGKTTWFIGQFLYILAASFVFVAATALFQLAAVTPVLGFSMEWGGVLTGLSQDFSPLWAHECNLIISGPLIRSYTPLEATTITFLMLWLTSSLVGTIILCFNTVICPGAGMIVAGLISAWSWFSSLGFLQYGVWILKTGVFHWCSLLTLQPLQSDGVTIPVAILIQLSAIILMVLFSCIVFSKKDTAFQKSLF